MRAQKSTGLNACVYHYIRAQNELCDMSYTFAKWHILCYSVVQFMLDYRDKWPQLRRQFGLQNARVKVALSKYRCCGINPLEILPQRELV